MLGNPEICDWLSAYENSERRKKIQLSSKIFGDKIDCDPKKQKSIEESPNKKN